MSATDSAPQTTGTLRVQRMPRWHTGRSELVVVAGLLALAAALTYGTVTMEVPDGTAFPGPQFFPTLVTVFLYGVSIWLAVDVIRSPQRTHVGNDPTEISNEMLEDMGAVDETSEIRVVSPEVVPVAEPAKGDVDWRTVTMAIASLAGFIVVLPVLGWLISASALFWLIARAFGSRRPLMDIGVGIIMASVVQLAFGAGLGLSLPSGILEGIFPWIS